MPRNLTQASLTPEHTSPFRRQLDRAGEALLGGLRTVAPALGYGHALLSGSRPACPASPPLALESPWLFELYPGCGSALSKWHLSLCGVQWFFPVCKDTAAQRWRSPSRPCLAGGFAVALEERPSSIGVPSGSCLPSLPFSVVRRPLWQGRRDVKFTPGCL